tara:strand:+ start:346 stop:954 length:609 start_codon:yes stop_codon:yes gene_type:complete
MEIYNIIIACLLGYIVGSIQPAFFIGKLKGIDIREHGSKNSGAANTTITLGWGWGIFTACFDIFKSTACVLITNYIYPSETIFNFLPFLSGALSIIGHNYPFYMNFKGGKGTASAIGLTLGFDPYWGLIMTAVIIITTIVTNYLVIGTLNIHLVLVYLSFFKYGSIEIILISLFLTGLSIYKHRENFIRIKNGTEPTFRGAL